MGSNGWQNAQIILVLFDCYILAQWVMLQAVIFFFFFLFHSLQEFTEINVLQDIFHTALNIHINFIHYTIY